MLQADVLIIGAGIVGAACAREFAQRGLSVAIVERAAPGGGATAASMGHLLVVDAEGASDEHEYRLSRRSMQKWADWLAASRDHGHGAEFQRCGTLWLAADDEEWRIAQRKAAWLQSQGLAAELLDAAALRQAEPLLHHRLVGALRVPADGRVYPPRVVQQWLDESRALLIRGEVQALHPGRVRLTDGRVVSAAMVVLCGGLASQRFLPEGCLVPKKGQLAITQAREQTLRHQLVELGYLKKAHLVDEDTVSFNVQPRPAGQWLIGSSRQIGRENREIDLPMLRRMLACAADYLPTLAQQSLLRCWSGIRPASRDGQPLIGAHPQLRSTWVACGHEGLGITTSLATAELLADLSLAQPAVLDAQPYDPARFPTAPAR